MKELLTGVGIALGLILSFLLGTLVVHVFTYGWFTPVS